MVQIETSWRYKYADNIRLALQQKDSKLSGKVRIDTDVMGEGYRPEMTVGESGYQRLDSRAERKTPGELAWAGRWVEPYDYDITPYLVHKMDAVRNGIEVGGTYVNAVTAAIRRSRDDVLLAAMFGSAKTGKNGSGTPETFDTANMRVASGSTGMTVAKITEMKKKFMYQEVDLDEEQLWGLITEEEWQDLMMDVQHISGDYNDKKPLAKGVVEEFVGCKFVQISSKRLTYKVSTARRCPFWVQSGVLLADYALTLPTLREAQEYRGNPTEVYAMWTLGATRLDKAKVGEILCE